MQPIFKNAAVSKDDIVDTMRDWIDEQKLLNTPRKSLIGYYFGRKILLTTPLLKWYLRKGLTITHIYTVIQYSKDNCFKEFGAQVADARREGDDNKLLDILADTFKLLGNSGYGKKHDRSGSSHGCQISRETWSSQNGQPSPFWADKRDAWWYMLGMLQFYYEFLDLFVNRSDFEYVEMDTDSAYITLAGQSWNLYWNRNW